MFAIPPLRRCLTFCAIALPLNALGDAWVPSVSNFLLASFDDAARVKAGLLSLGMIVRPIAAERQTNG